eukprot:m.137162 g.137162  ORF g.137162 m.137162 type:complete len:903 (+) comp14894_c0_seq12:288-2996(+)
MLSLTIFHRFISLALLVLGAAAAISTAQNIDANDFFNLAAEPTNSAPPNIHSLSGTVAWLVSAFNRTRETVYTMRLSLNATRSALRETRERVTVETSRTKAAEARATALARQINFTATLAMNEAKVNKVALVAEVQRAQTAEASLQIAVQLEASRATAAENALSALLQANDADLATQIGAARSAATAATLSQATALANEVQRATAAEAAELARATNAEAQLGSAIADETSRAVSAEQAINNNIVATSNTFSTEITAAKSIAAAGLAAETQRATAAEAQLGSAIADETSRAVFAEQTINSDINSVNLSLIEQVSFASASILNVAAQLDREAQWAIAADATVNARVSQEQARAIAVENQLSSAVRVEISRAMTAEASVATLVSQEQARAIAVENQLSSAVRMEVSRAMTAEQAVSSAVGQSQELLQEQVITLNNVVVTEIMRAIGTENQLSSAIRVETSRAITAEQGISTVVSALSTCPKYAVDAPACKCGPGTVGSLTWTGQAWAGVCTVAACPQNAVGAPDCECDDFTTGALNWNGTSWTGTCVATGTGVRSMSTAGAVTCAVAANRRVKCWGAASNGGLGMSAAGSATNATTASFIPNINNAAVVRSGLTFSCALLVNSSLLCWGSNLYGQTGLNSSIATAVTTPFHALSNVTQFSLGSDHACALMSNADVRCWGRNNNGQLGNGSTVDITTGPPSYAVATGVKQVVCSYVGSYIVKFNGDVFCSGLVHLSMITTPSVFAFYGNIGANGTLSCGAYHCCAILPSTALRCWGTRNNGQLGVGATSTAPLPLGSATDTFASGVVKVVGGAAHTCALDNQGRVWCWGLNSDGQLGNGVTAVQTTPIQVSQTGVRDIFTATSAFHTCATLLTGGFKCWGFNNNGQLGIGTFVSAQPVTALNTIFL